MSKKRLVRKNRKLEKMKLEKNKKFSKIFYLKKKVSETPLELLEKFKKTNKFLRWQKKENKKGYQKIPLAYAGRLDPMANGKMLILAGEACKERDKYLNLDKEYIFEILFGFSSDTGDILGIVKSDKNFYKNKLNKKELKKKLKIILEKIKEKKEMKYPIFSSKTVEGKPLFLWALEKKIDKITIPIRKINIFRIKLTRMRMITKEKMKKEIFLKIQNLKKVEESSKELGRDFRRIEVLESWEKSLKNFSDQKYFLILKIKTKVSSGTYMRSLAQEIAKKLKTKGLAYSIKRTKFF